VNHTVRIQAQLSQLAAARQFVEDTGARLGLPSAVTNPLILAVDESLSNRSFGCAIRRRRSTQRICPTRTPVCRSTSGRWAGWAD
jgi:hypothetical protein